MALTQEIHIRLSVEQYNALKEIAREEGDSFSSVCRRAMTAYCQMRKKIRTMTEEENDG